MTATEVPVFETTIHTTNEWIGELEQELGRRDRQQAYRIMRAVLMALRDRLTVEEATDLGAQLPMLVRGFYYEGWNPSKTPTRERNLQAFLDHVVQNMQEPIDGDPEEAVRAVFGLLSRHVTPGEIEHVRGSLPKDVQRLWN
jgi:uncharacterized protein (DUF2267 family)